MHRFIFLLLLPLGLWAQPSSRSAPPAVDACELRITAVVSVNDAHHTFWIAFSGPCETISRIWKRILFDVVPPFIESVLALFPGQQPQIVSWSAEWG